MAKFSCLWLFYSFLCNFILILAFYHVLVACKHSKKDVGDPLVAGMDNDAEKKKKKKKDKSNSDSAVHQPESDKTLEGSMNSGDKMNGSNLESETKSKEKVKKHEILSFL